MASLRLGRAFFPLRVKLGMRRTAQYAVIAILSLFALICAFQVSPYLKNRLKEVGIASPPATADDRETTAASDAPAWEHKIVDRSELSAGNGPDVDARAEAVRRLDAYGAQGWELAVSVDDALVFKRPKR